MRSVWVVGEWDAACGARPSGGDLPGEFVTIRQSGGELSISGSRSVSTAGCSHGGGDLQMAQHTSGPRSWSSVCKSAAGSERDVVVRTTVNATDRAIQFDESGQYRFRAGEHNCTASSRRTRQFELVERWAPPAGEGGDEAPSAGPQTAGSVGAQAVAIKDRCQTLGPAAFVELKPKQKLLMGGQSADFELSVRDAAGCPLPPSTVNFGLEPAANGLQWVGRTLSAASDAAETETELVARAGNVSSSARISVVSRERYEALLGPNSGQTGPIAAPDAMGTAMPALGASMAVAENRAVTRKVWFGAFVGLTAAALGALGLVLLRQSRVRQPNTSPAPVPVAAPVVPKICPKCGLMYGTEAQFCGKDGSYLVQAN
jgi:hypothetical protein